MYKLGLIAKDIKNSVTPGVYRHLMASVDEECTYEIRNIPEEALAETVEYARTHWNGFNVTMPYKQTVLSLVDELDESAKQCGSTNTILVKNGRLVAYNTDGWGLIRALEQKGFDFAGKKVVMVGAGGVAYSIAYHLSIHGVWQVEVVNLYPEQTQALCEKFGERFLPHALRYDVLDQCCQDADLFINASVMGQLGYDEYESVDFLDHLKKDAVVFDVNYSNPKARLVAAARERGLQAYIGSCMTACQGVRVMEIWTGKIPSEKAVNELIAKFTQGGNKDHE